MPLPFRSLLLLFALGACSSANDPSRTVFESDELPASAGLVCEGEGSEAERCSWQSSDWSDGTWLGYPGQSTLVVPHELNRVPTGVWVYISFASNGASAALASGDLARIVEVTENDVTIHNATNADYYCRIVLQ